MSVSRKNVSENIELNGLVKLTLLDIINILSDNRGMGERLTENAFTLTDGAKNIITDFLQGSQFESDGYEDLGLTLQWNALNKIRELKKEEREQVVDVLFPVEK